MKTKIALIVKIPPPITGVTTINKLLINSKVLREKFNIKTIGISYSNKIEDFGNVHFGKILKYFEYLTDILKSLRDNKIKLFYFPISIYGVAFFRDLIFILLIKVKKKKLVIHLHGKGIAERVARNRILKMIYKWAFKDTFIICLSELVAKDIELVYSPKPFILHNGIPPVSYNFSQKNNKPVQLIFLSNLIRSKGIYDFINTFRFLDALDIKGIIVGQDGDVKRSEIQQYCNELNLTNNIAILGPLYGKEKQQAIIGSDILVHPTLDDAWALVVLEAMNAAKPVIATFEGSLPEIIVNGETGFLVDKNSPSQIANKVRLLYNSIEDRIKMGHAGYYRFLQNYTFELFEVRLANILSSIVDENQ